MAEVGPQATQLDFHQAMQDFRVMFPDMDASVIEVSDIQIIQSISTDNIYLSGNFINCGCFLTLGQVILDALQNNPPHLPLCAKRSGLEQDSSRVGNVC